MIQKLPQTLAGLQAYVNVPNLGSGAMCQPDRWRNCISDLLKLGITGYEVSPHFLYFFQKIPSNPHTVAVSSINVAIFVMMARCMKVMQPILSPRGLPASSVFYRRNLSLRILAQKKFIPVPRHAHAFD